MNTLKTGYYPGNHVGNNVHGFLDQHLKNNPKLQVLKWIPPEVLRNPANLAKMENDPMIQHESITVEQLHDRIGRVAAGFEDLGIKKGDRAIVFIPMSLHLYTAMFALQKIGAIAVFLDSWARKDHLGASAKIVSPKAIISFEKAYEYCEGISELNEIPLQICVGPHTKQYSAHLEKLVETQRHAEICGVEQEDTALITFTTGSSGTPKGANRTHRFLAAQHYALHECIPYNKGDVDLPVFPIFSLNNLASGVSTVIPAFDIGVPGDHDPLVLLAQINSCNVTCTTLSPSLFNRLSAYCIKKGIKLQNLRRVVTGGAPVSRDNVIDMQKIAPNAEILVLFGSTEAEPMAHIEAKDMINLKTRASEDPEWVDEGVNVGKMADGLLYRFIKIQKGPVTVASSKDWTHLTVANGQVGELIVAGEHVCRNYYNDEIAFTRAKIKDENQTVWHRTGDLGRVDENGNLWIVGRVHNAIQRSDRYEFPVRAEMIMKKLPFVKLCAYLGITDAKLGERAVCVIVPTDTSSVGNSNVESNMSKEIGRLFEKNGVPADQIIFSESIPMDPRHHSKVEYEVLRKTLVEQNLV
jgi:acyl-CoA synthetase (AMP-forming)/AMP-acid ligase II